ncbi:MAG: C25 family cysteine peptidase [Chloroflexota bacterium]
MRKNLSILLFVIFLTACSSPATQTVIPSAPPTIPTQTGAPTQTEMPVLTSTPVVTASPMCENEACLANGLQLEYLIVTRPMFIETLKPFMDWKSGHGFRVGLVTVEWLDANYTGRHLAEKMKTGMQDLHKKTGLRYVLLVGDTVVNAGDNWAYTASNLLNSYDLSNPFNVPTGFYRRVNTDPPMEVLASDAYFVEDRDWDPDNTGLNPRPDNMESSEGTLQAALYLGRWPVRTADEIGIIFEKTKAVTPASSVFFTADNTLVQENQTPCIGWPPGEYGKMGCYQDVMVTGFKQFFGSKAPWLDSKTLFVDINENSQATALMEEIRANTGVMYLSYHGNLDCLGVQGGDCTPASNFTFESNFPLLDIQACLVANFTYPSRSFMELVLLSPTGPAVVSQSPNPVLFFRDLRDGKTVGEAFWSEGSVWVYWPNPILLLGDPSLQVLVTPASP